MLRAPPRGGPLERRGVTQAHHNHWQHVPVASGTTEGQALLQHPDGGIQVPLGEVQVAEVVVDNDRCGPSACQRGKAQCLLPVAPALSKGPERAQVCASHAWDWIRKFVLAIPDSRSAASTLRLNSSAARPKSPMAWYICARR